MYLEPRINSITASSLSTRNQKQSIALLCFERTREKGKVCPAQGDIIFIEEC